MASGVLLPLFPLQLVLFPGVELPLHIFEPRYREMVGEAIEGKSEFGVILADGGKVCSAGCTAVVEKVTERFDDGRFNVATRGQRRFRVLELNKEKDYARAQVEFFQDVADEPVPKNLLTQVRELATKLALTMDWEALDVTGDKSQTSYAIAAALPLELTFKQELLEQRREKQRMRALVDHLGSLLKRSRVTERMQKLAGTNGHGGRAME